MATKKKERGDIKIYVTGIAGFLGSRLAIRLNELGYDVYGCDTLQFGFKKNLPENIKWAYRDFANETAEELNRYDILCHCATKNIIYAIKEPIDTYKTNATDSMDLVNKFNGKIIYTSTASVYGQANNFPTKEDSQFNTTNAYDSSKLVLEKFLQRRKNYTTLRCSNIFGIAQNPENPYCGVLGKFIHNAMINQPIPVIGDGSATRDYTYVSDVVDAIVLAIEQEAKNTEINISSGKETSVMELVKTVEKLMDYPLFIHYLPNRKIDGLTRRWLDNRKALALLGWEPKVSLESGIKKTMEWMATKDLVHAK